MRAFLRSLATLRCIGAAAAIAVASACGDSTGPSPGGSQPITELPRSLTVTETEVIERATSFGLDLLRRTSARDERPNIVLSPFSASMALGMTLNGAAGTTFDAMRSTLGFEGMAQGDINAAYASLIPLLTSLDPTVRFDIANSVWANAGFPFHQSFFDTVSTAFQARVETRDFGLPATLDAINGWVRDETRGLIPSILDQLDPALVMVLMNAIYFDGAWTEAFDPDETTQGAFVRADGTQVDVDMMSQSDFEVMSGGGSNYAAIELPYGGGAYAMLLVVPTGPADIRSIVAGFTPTAFDQLVSGMAERELDRVQIPRFTLAYDAFLNSVLDDMGMGVAFRPGADFTRLSPRGDELCIDFVRQKTFIEVDEAGTRAAAVTAVGIGPTSFNGFVIDRPFFFAIRERLSGTLLFTGIIGDPTIEDSGSDSYTSTCG